MYFRGVYTSPPDFAGTQIFTPSPDIAGTPTHILSNRSHHDVGCLRAGGSPQSDSVRFGFQKGNLRAPTLSGPIGSASHPVQGCQRTHLSLPRSPPCRPAGG